MQDLRKGDRGQRRKHTGTEGRSIRPPVQLSRAAFAAGS